MSEFIISYQGQYPNIANDVFLAPNASVIGDVKIGQKSSLWFATSVRGDVNEIRIGARTNVQDGAVIHVTTGGNGAYIGNDVTIGHLAILHACTLEDMCLVGMGSCVLDGAVVETHSMVAAGALVTPGKRVASGQLWAGTPAHHLRDLTTAEIEDIEESAHHYTELAEEYLASSVRKGSV